jgi:hypothetical protein
LPGEAALALSAEQNEILAALARQLVASMGAIAITAQRVLGSTSGAPSPPTGSALAVAQNTMVGPSRGVIHIDRIRQQRLVDLSQVRDEPFIAYVVAEDEGGQRHRFYFARSAALAGSVGGVDGTLASYRAPFARLAEVAAGETVQVPLPTRLARYTVLERARVRPVNTTQGWDGRDDRIEAAELRVTVESLLERAARRRSSSLTML